MHHRINLILLVSLVSASLCYAQKLPDIPVHKVVLEDHEKVLKFELQEDEKKVNTNRQLYYTWFAHHKIHTTRGDFEGRLLHGEYLVFNKERDLLEKGNFKYGVKTKVWKTWYQDGELKTITHFKNGQKHGLHICYDDMGDVISKTNYRHGKKHGKTHSFDEDGDETITKYKEGKEVSQKRKWFFKSDDEQEEDLLLDYTEEVEEEKQPSEKKSRKKKKKSEDKDDKE